MRHLREDSIVSRSASPENPNFPISRTADMHPKRKYKALQDEWRSIITLGVVGGCSDIMLAGTNAINATVSVTDPNEIAWAEDDYWADDSDTWINGPINITASVTQRSRSSALWLQFSEVVNRPCEIEMTTACQPAETLEIGVIRAGLSETYGGRNPRFGLPEDGDDKSIFDDNSNGSFYYKKRDILRVFSASAIMSRTDAWLMADYFDVHGQEPSAWRITDKNDSEWVLFARLLGRPSIQHSHLSHCDVSFDLKEVL